MNSELPSSSEWSEQQRKVEEAPFPMVFAAPSIVDMYCQLELRERGVQLETIRNHAKEVALWYEGLSLLVEPFPGEWEYPDTSLGQEVLLIFSQILALEISLAKSGLDSLLAGHYSPALTSVRHMLEANLQMNFLRLCPEEIAAWGQDQKTPTSRVMIRKLKRAAANQDDAQAIDSIQRALDILSKGAHPTGLGLTQTHPSDREPHFVFGPSYRTELAQLLFHYGLYGLELLLIPWPFLGRTTNSWNLKYHNWCEKVTQWRTARGEVTDSD